MRHQSDTQGLCLQWPRQWAFPYPRFQPYNNKELMLFFPPVCLCSLDGFVGNRSCLCRGLECPLRATISFIVLHRDRETKACFLPCCAFLSVEMFMPFLRLPCIYSAAFAWG